MKNNLLKRKSIAILALLGSAMASCSDGPCYFVDPKTNLKFVNDISGVQNLSDEEIKSLYEGMAYEPYEYYMLFEDLYIYDICSSSSSDEAAEEAAYAYGNYMSGDLDINDTEIEVVYSDRYCRVLSCDFYYIETGPVDHCNLISFNSAYVTYDIEMQDYFYIVDGKVDDFQNILDLMEYTNLNSEVRNKFILSFIGEAWGLYIYSSYWFYPRGGTYGYETDLYFVSRTYYVDRYSGLVAFQGERVLREIKLN